MRQHGNAYTEVQPMTRMNTSQNANRTIRSALIAILLQFLIHVEPLQLRAQISGIQPQGTPEKITEPDVRILFTAYPEVQSVSPVEVHFDTATFQVTFRTDQRGMVANFGSLTRGENRDMVTFLRISLSEISRDGKEVVPISDIPIVRISPSLLDETQPVYTVRLSLREGSFRYGSRLQAKVRTEFDVLRDKSTQNQLAWLDRAISTFMRSTNANISGHLFATVEALKSSVIEETNAANYINLILSNLQTSATNLSTTALNLALTNPAMSNVAIELGDNTTWFSKVYGNPTNRQFTSVIEHLRTAPQPLTAQQVSEVLWALSLRKLAYVRKVFPIFSNFVSAESIAKAQTDAARISTVTAVATANPSNEKIFGFTNVVSDVELLPTKEVGMNLGNGIRDHFYVVRVTFLNTNTSDVLIYGDRIIFKCDSTLYSWDSPSDHKRLVGSIPDRDLFIIPSPEESGSTNSNAYRIGKWSSSKAGIAGGQVYKQYTNLNFNAYSMEFLIRGYDTREFHTKKATVFRSLGAVADTATGLIPFLSSQRYSDGAGIFSGIVLPGAKKLLGDASEIQKQTFLTHSMPQYLELKIGQTMSKLIYLPRYGQEVRIPGRIAFIASIGRPNDLEFKVALIQTAERGFQLNGSRTPLGN